MGEVDAKAVRDLLGAPRFRPSSVSSSTVTPTDEPHLGTNDPLTVRSDDRPGEAILDVVPQPIVAGELRCLGPPGLELGFPLRNRCPVLEGAAPRGGVSSELTRDRRR